MSWVAAIATLTSGSGEPERADCESCGAVLRPGVATCDHCRRPRRAVQQDVLDGRPGGIVRVAPTPAPSPAFEWATPPAPLYSPPPAPAYEPPAPAPDFSSGGGGSFGGGGASGDW